MGMKYLITQRGEVMANIETFLFLQIVEAGNNYALVGNTTESNCILLGEFENSVNAMYYLQALAHCINNTASTVLDFKEVYDYAVDRGFPLINLDVPKDSSIHIRRELSIKREENERCYKNCKPLDREKIIKIKGEIG